MKRTSGFIEPCLPSLADRPPPGSDWIHEIKHDGFRLLACRGAAGIRLLTRNGTDFTARHPLIVEALAALPVRSCVIDGEAVAYRWPWRAEREPPAGATSMSRPSPCRQPVLGLRVNWQNVQALRFVLPGERYAGVFQSLTPPSFGQAHLSLPQALRAAA
jgi:hypothetical protein